MSQPVYHFDEIVDRWNTNSVKVDLVPFMQPDLPDDFISMWVADQDFACAPPILDAMKRRLDKRVLGYSKITDPDFFQAVVNWQKKRNDWDVRASNFVFSAGVVKAVDVLVDLLTKEGDGIIFNTPAYHPFDDIGKKKKRVVHYSKLFCDEKGYYTMNYDEIEELCKDPNNKLFIFCNPHNPTGRVWKEEEIRRVCDICLKNDVFIISDEIHSDLLRYGQKHIPVAKLYPNEKRIIVCTAPSKTFNLASNQLSNIYIPDKKIRNQWGFLGGFPNPLSVEACKAAYNECEPWLDQMRKYLDDNFNLLKERLEKELPEAVFYISEGTYLAWIDLSKLGLDDAELKRRITRAGVLLEYNTDFVHDAEGHVRMNISCPRSVLNEAITRIVKAVKEGYEAPQFQGQLKTGEKFPVSAFANQFPSFSLSQNGKTIVAFLRHSGCQLTQLYLEKLNAVLSKINGPGHKVYAVINSSEDFYKKNPHVEFESSPEHQLLFDLEGKSYDLLSVKCAQARHFLMDMTTQGLIDKVIDRNIQGYTKEEKSRDLQRPALFILDKEGTILHSHYGHGAGDIEYGEKLVKLL